MNENDVKLLDFIIEKTLFKSSVKAEDLINEKLINDKNILNFNDNFKYNPEDEFTRLSYIIKQYEVANVINTNDGTLISANELTDIFKKNGGFKKKFGEISNKEEKESLEFEKSKIDLKLKKLQLKTFWVLFGVAIIGFGFSVYNFIDSLKISKDTTQQEMQIKKMESELTKLRTSFLNQKKVDSLHNPNFGRTK